MNELDILILESIYKKGTYLLLGKMGYSFWEISERIEFLMENGYLEVHDGIKFVTQKGLKYISNKKLFILPDYTHQIEKIDIDEIFLP